MWVLARPLTTPGSSCYRGAEGCGRGDLAVGLRSDRPPGLELPAPSREAVCVAAPPRATAVGLSAPRTPGPLMSPCPTPPVLVPAAVWSPKCSVSRTGRRRAFLLGIICGAHGLPVRRWVVTVVQTGPSLRLSTLRTLDRWYSLAIMNEAARIAVCGWTWASVGLMGQGSRHLHCAVDLSVWTERARRRGPALLGGGSCCGFLSQKGVRVIS